MVIDIKMNTKPIMDYIEDCMPKQEEIDNLCKEFAGDIIYDMGHSSGTVYNSIPKWTKTIKIEHEIVETIISKSGYVKHRTIQKTTYYDKYGNKLTME